MTDPEGAYWLRAIVRRIAVLCDELESLKKNEPQIFADIMASPQTAKLREILNSQTEFDL